MSGYPKLPLQAHSSTSTSSNPAALQPQSGSWSGTRPVPENTPAAPITSHQDSQSTASSTRPSAISRSTSDVDQRSTATSCM
ncbi:hypothetical protein BC939DRAFT_434927 [Gamsiella multidivaricata]|uniref:uncharacterized protein n=1 Tax=Gamsiella multidivaricata TaxID=101098 RepID=UPI00221FEC9A|nr:uncharacterized protein BC939DRAFT_434927 [Gamsiella multidivaricata]KAI7832228.1 hypothetical protein BC939DRAFT_434927 [Gamsiella multidivaricata]